MPRRRARTSRKPPRASLGVVLAAGVVSATLYWLAFPPVAAWPLAFVALAPLLNRGPDLGPGGRFVAGWWCGGLIQSGVYYWLWHTAQSMSGLGPWAAAGILLGYGLTHGLFGGIWLFALGALGRGAGRWAFALLAASSFVLLEAVFPFIFPWHLGDALYRAPRMAQAADLGGVHLLSFLGVFCAALLARSVRPHGADERRDLIAPVVALLIVLSALAGYGEIRQRQLDAAPPATLEVAWVQPNISAKMKRSRGVEARSVIFDRVLDVDAELGPLDGVDLLVWPEGGFPFYFRPVDHAGLDPGRETFPHRFTRRLLAHVRRRGVPLITGALRRPQGEATRNSAALIRPDGRYDVYDKRRLVPFGERVPLGDAFPALVGAIPGTSHMKPGHGAGVVEVADRRLLLHLCYETIFPWSTRSDVLATRPDLIVNLTNDVWFGATSAPELHLMVQVMRTIETRRPLLRVTNTGISALVDHAGRIQRRTAIYESATGRWTVPVGGADSVWLRHGGLFWPALGMILLCAAMAAAWGRRRA